MPHVTFFSNLVQHSATLGQSQDYDYLTDTQWLEVSATTPAPVTTTVLGSHNAESLTQFLAAIPGTATHIDLMAGTPEPLEVSATTPAPVTTTVLGSHTMEPDEQATTEVMSYYGAYLLNALAQLPANNNNTTLDLGQNDTHTIEGAESNLKPQRLRLSALRHHTRGAADTSPCTANPR